MISITLTVFYEEPYWVGLVERTTDSLVEIGKATFGAEPSNAELTDFVLRKLDTVRLHAMSGALRLPRLAKPGKDQSSRTQRSLDIYKGELTQRARERKAASRKQAQEEQAEKYVLMREKKKKKKQGH